MSETAAVRLDVDDRGVATITMGDATGRNAMSALFVHELSEALHTLAACTDARVAVLLGLPEVFSSGASREMLEAILDGKVAPSDIVLPKVVLDLPMPVIAAMEGHAVGGGQPHPSSLEANAQHLPIAKQHRSARTTLPERRHGDHRFVSEPSTLVDLRPGKFPQ